MAYIILLYTKLDVSNKKNDVFTVNSRFGQF